MGEAENVFAGQHVVNSSDQSALVAAQRWGLKLDQMKTPHVLAIVVTLASSFLQCGQAAVITDNLSTYFTFDSSQFATGTGNVINSVGTGNATIVPGTGTVTNPAGQIGQAADASQTASSGTNVSRIVADSTSTGDVGAGSFSMSIWFNADNLLNNGSTNVPNFVTNGRSGSSTPGWALGLRLTGSGASTVTQLLFAATDTTTGAGHNYIAFPNVTYTSGNWYQVGVTFDSISRDLVLYSDGAVISTISIAPTVGSLDNPTSYLTFFTNNANTFPFDGVLDDFGLWTGRVLTSDEMASIHSQGLLGESLLTAVPEPGSTQLAVAALFGLLAVNFLRVRRKSAATPTRVR